MCTPPILFSKTLAHWADELSTAVSGGIALIVFVLQCMFIMETIKILADQSDDCGQQVVHSI